jgi:hypothetical protein
MGHDSAGCEDAESIARRGPGNQRNRGSLVAESVPEEPFPFSLPRCSVGPQYLYALFRASAAAIGQMDFVRRVLPVGQSKTDAGTGRVLPLNDHAFAMLSYRAGLYPERQRESIARSLQSVTEALAMLSLRLWCILRATRRLPLAAGRKRGNPRRTAPE